MDIKQSKSILARLLAKENLTVQHKNIPTAYFDTKNRLLALPIWKDMSTDLYDLLTGHEVGHALYTPAQGWHDQVMDKDFGDHFKGFLNVLEDARIEKLIKRQYPGIRKNFYQAYKELYEKDFFGVSDVDLDDLLFIDRINLHFKVGAFLNLEFAPKEQELIDEIEAIETWDQVVEIARRLYTMAQDELKEKQMKAQGDLMKFENAQNDDDDGQGASEEFDLTEQESQDLLEKIMDMQSPESLTDKAFRDREQELLDEKSLPFNYYTLGEYDANPYVWSYKTMLDLHTFTPEQEARRGQVYAAFRLKNLKFINYLVKEFELRRNAQQLSRAQVSKSGEIDVEKLFKYKFSEDLFLKVTSIPKGKNHGLIMFYDMSGSMHQSIAGVIEQILILVEFCRKVNIPFEVYGFTNDNRVFWNNEKTKIYQEQASLRRGAHVDGQLAIVDNDFRLQQYFSNNMSAADYKRMVGNLCMIQKTWSNNTRRYNQEYDYNWSGSMPDCEHMHSTPLNATVLLSRNIFERFKARTGAEIVNMVILTDGDSDQCVRACAGQYESSPDRRYQTIESGWYTNTFFTDTRTKTQVQVKGRHASKSVNVALLEMMRQVTGCNIVGFYLAGNVRSTVQTELRSQSDQHQYTHEEKIMEGYKKDRVAILTQAGYNEYYIVKNDLAINDDFEVAADADVKDIGRAFRKMQKGKVLNRVLLNRFIKMIA